MSVTITSSLTVALVSGTGVTFNAPVVNLISTDNVYDVNNPTQTLTDMINAISSAELVGSANINGNTVGNTTIYTVPTGEKFIPTSIVFALTGITGSGVGPVINTGFTATDYDDYIDSTITTRYELDNGAFFAAGSGYSIGNTLTLSGGTVVSNDFATVDVTSGPLVSVAVNAAGTVYTPGDTVTMAGGVPVTRAIVTVQTVKLVSATINAGGTGYGATQTFNVTVVGGTRTVVATVNVTSDGAGVVDTVNSVVGGSYTVLPSLTANAVTGGTGSGLTLDLVFGINTITITTAGEYTTEVSSFTQFATSGSGTGATFNTALYGILGYTVSNPGTYITLPSNHIATTGGSGTGATFDGDWVETAGNFLTVGTSGELIQFVDLANEGANFVYMTGGEVLKVRVAFASTFTTYTLKAFVFGFTFA
jgi:hypothetical protein